MDRFDREYRDGTSKYRLVGNSIYSPDGEGGWYLVDDDCPSDVDGFRYRCGSLSEELRCLRSEALAEFGRVS